MNVKLKFFLMFLSLFICGATLWGTRPLSTPFIVKQSDGNLLTVTKHGCHRYVFYASTDGVALMRGENGNFYYAIINDGNLQVSSLLAHDPHQRNESERSFVMNNTKTVQEAYSLLNKSHPTDNILTRSLSRDGDGLGTYGNPNPNGVVSSIGKINIPVIMVEFADVSFSESTTIDKVSRMLNEEGYADEKYCVGSARDYFVSQSYGMFEPSFEVVASVKVANNRSYYGKNAFNGSADVKCYELVQEALDSALIQGVDFSRFALQNDGVPLVSIFHAGPGEHSSFEVGCDDYIWAHFSRKKLSAGSTKVNSYFIGNELLQDYGTDDDDNLIVTGADIDGIGVFVHEFSHALGLPDFYYTGTSGAEASLIQSPGYWSVMDYGQYVYDGYAPMGYSAYERSMLGWLEILEPQEEAYYELHPFSSAEGKAKAYLLRNDEMESEYYILENRQSDTWYPAIFGHGMLVFHVTYDYMRWIQNKVNNDPDGQLYYVVAADGDRNNVNDEGYYQPKMYVGDLFPGTQNVTSLTDDTTPGTSLYFGEKLGKPIYDIKEVDGIISFCYKNPELIGIAHQYVEDKIDGSVDEIYGVDGKRYKGINKEYRGFGLIKKNGKYLKVVF